MNVALQFDVIRALRKTASQALGSLSFTMLEIGAVPIDGETEPFHLLTDIFPESKVIAFEIDKGLCEKLNFSASDGHKFYPVALGRTEETRQFFNTADPMCSSLYRPNQDLLAQFFHMECATLKEVTSVDTVSLDYFIAHNGIDDVDFIKIDIQGAELDVFQGGVDTLKDVGIIVSEAEFIPQYVDQPLFGDVCGFLMKHGFMFHKFVGVGSRALRPAGVNDSQHVWADVMFIKDILRLSELPIEKLLKMGILSYLYNSSDLAFICFHTADKKGQTDIAQKFLQVGRKFGVPVSRHRWWTALFRR